MPTTSATTASVVESNTSTITTATASTTAFTDATATNATTNSNDALNTTATMPTPSSAAAAAPTTAIATTHSQQQIPNTFLIGPIHTMSAANSSNGASASAGATGGGGVGANIETRAIDPLTATANVGNSGTSNNPAGPTGVSENVVIAAQGNPATFIAVTHQQLQQHQQLQLQHQQQQHHHHHQQSSAHSTSGIGPPATLTSNLLGFVGGIGIASTTASLPGGQPVFVTGLTTIASNNNNNTSGFNNNNNPNDNNNNMDNTSEDSNPVTIYR